MVYQYFTKSDLPCTEAHIAQDEMEVLKALGSDERHMFFIEQIKNKEPKYQLAVNLYFSE